ncbi:hypothetical protein F5Y18DRAFT_403150 [Xylariaceae sp. FL1019]|nr:hypothetical protein F5Y18DRAFT_403150 [Xylariaceae sp. FL1019]
MALKGLLARGAPRLPKYTLYIVGATILLSVIVLALAAYAQSLSGRSSYYYDSGIAGFLIFVAIWTWLVFGGIFGLEKYLPRFYYRVGVLVAQILTIIFWLSAWAWAASWAAYILSFDSYAGFDGIGGSLKAFGQSIGACAGIGALIWIMSIVVLFIFSRACTNDTNTSTADVELGNSAKVNSNTSHNNGSVAAQPVRGEGQHTLSAS